ncbi:dynamin family protein [Longispora sp. NPDC051575]|uniref:dynamin family protein n=1 Tax=Longispora sp. NPDC051575 TaxID=3154943 RepID=UPI00341889B9
MTGADKLAATLKELRGMVRGARFPLETPGASQARTVAHDLSEQLDDYLLPRLARLDAPVLVVVGGSTGAGKSTLINSLVRAPVSAAGVLRPTTRSPVLVSHPADSQWFRGFHILPKMSRATGMDTGMFRAIRDEDERPNPAANIHLVTATGLTPGLAFIDAPDIDSMVASNRELAGQLFAAADLWLFVTTAARYSDAVPWEFLHAAKERDVALALVMDRVPPGAEAEVTAHFEELLAEHGLDEEQLFTISETPLDSHGLLPEAVIRPLSEWFAKLAGDATSRAEVVRRTLDGAVKSVPDRVRALADASEEQTAERDRVNGAVDDAYAEALDTVRRDLSDGALLKGEVLARWQELVGTGELLRALQARLGRWRDRVTAAVTGRQVAGEPLREALTSGVAAVITAAGVEADDRARAAVPEPPEPDPVTPAQAERLVRDWQAAVLELVRVEGASKRGVARVAAYTVNATGLLVMIAVFTATSFIPTGAEVGVAAGTTVVGQKILEAIFGDQAVRTLAAKARKDLLTRVEALYDERRTPLLLDPPLAVPVDLRELAAEVERARKAWGMLR